MDPILFWNDVALEANRVSHTNGKKRADRPHAELARSGDRPPGDV